MTISSMKGIITRSGLAMGQPDAKKLAAGEAIDPVLILAGGCKPDGVAMDGRESDGLKTERQQPVDRPVRDMYQRQAHFTPGIAHGRDDLILPIE